MLPAHSPAAVLPFQPTPVGLVLAYIPEANPERTAILREFAAGEARFCRLCPRDLCSYTARGSCLVIAPEVVAPGEAALYRLPG